MCKWSIETYGIKQCSNHPREWLWWLGRVNSIHYAVQMDVMSGRVRSRANGPHKVYAFDIARPNIMLCWVRYISDVWYQNIPAGCFVTGPLIPRTFRGRTICPRTFWGRTFRGRTCCRGTLCPTKACQETLLSVNALRVYKCNTNRDKLQYAVLITNHSNSDVDTVSLTGAGTGGSPVVEQRCFNIQLPSNLNK